MKHTFTSHFIILCRADMKSKTGFDFGALDRLSDERKQTAGKNIYGVSHLPPDVSELIYKTCSLAASKPSAIRVLATSMRKIYSQVEAICKDSGTHTDPVVNDMNEVADAPDDLTVSELPCVDSPTLKSRMAYLSKALEEPGISSPYCSKREPTSAMMDAVELQTTVELERQDESGLSSDTILEYESLEALAGTLTKLQSSEVDKTRREIEEMVGCQIEVFCPKAQVWRSAHICSEDPGNRAVLVYFDGVVESVLLETVVWRPVE